MHFLPQWEREDHHFNLRRRYDPRCKFQTEIIDALDYPQTIDLFSRHTSNHQPQDRDLYPPTKVYLGVAREVLHE